MKGQRWIILLLALAMLLTGCGAASRDTVSEMNRYEGKSEMEVPEQGGIYDEVDYSTAVRTTGQKLIKTVELTTETEDMDQFLTALNQQIDGLNGYVESRNIQNGSGYSGNRSRWANLTIRVPVERLNELVAQVQGLSNVIDYSENVDDVTTAYVDTESRKKALETEYERLLVLLEQAQNMADLLEIESRMTEVRYELESITSQLRVYDNKITYATVCLSVDEVGRLTPVEQETIWQRIAGRLAESWKGLTDGLVDIFVFLVGNSPYLIFALLVAFAVVALVLRRRKRGKKTDEASKKVKQDEN